MRAIPAAAVTLPLVGATLLACCAAVAILAVLVPSDDECLHPGGEHEAWSEVMPELQQVMEGEAARGKRMIRLLSDDPLGYELAANAEYVHRGR